MWWDAGSFAVGLVLGQIVGLFLAALMSDLGKPADEDFEQTEVTDHD